MLVIVIVVDAYKLLHVYQRPVPKNAEDIGAFEGVFLVISYCAVVTNAAITVFTLPTFDGLSPGSRMWIFVGFQYFCFFMVGLVQVLVPDRSEEYDVQVRRNQLLERKLIDHIPDEVIVSTNKSNIDFDRLDAIVEPLDSKIRDYHGMLAKRHCDIR